MGSSCRLSEFSYETDFFPSLSPLMMVKYVKSNVYFFYMYDMVLSTNLSIAVINNLWKKLSFSKE